MSTNSLPGWLEGALQDLGSDAGTRMVIEAILDCTDRLSPWPRFVLADRMARTVHEFQPPLLVDVVGCPSPRNRTCSFRWELAKLTVGAEVAEDSYQTAALKELSRRHESTCELCATIRDADRRAEAETHAQHEAAERTL